ncbi:hypothetical protein V1264_006775 [Littorina saxatilis]|uniref:Uncharacterized protein n=1 Tax=Littorina saxatilis TaxID=31220 RepID=A0AAN9AXT5_9CAEN
MIMDTDRGRGRSSFGRFVGNRLGAQGRITEAQAPEDETESNSRVRDGGYGWVVCFTSLLAHGTIVGFLNAMGIVYVALLKAFADGDPIISFKTSWVGSLTLSMTFVLGSVGGVLSDRFGIRRVAFLGGLLVFLGMLSSAFVSHLLLLYLTLGVLTGVGFGFTYSASIVILGHYFYRRIGLANAIVMCGASVFSIGYALLLPLLFEGFGLRNTLLCLCGVNSLLMLYACTWKPNGPPEAPVARASGHDTDGLELHEGINIEHGRNLIQHEAELAFDSLVVGYEKDKEVGEKFSNEVHGVACLPRNDVDHNDSNARVQIDDDEVHRDGANNVINKDEVTSEHWECSEFHPDAPVKNTVENEDILKEARVTTYVPLRKGNEDVFSDDTNLDSSQSRQSCACCERGCRLLNKQIWKNRRYVLWLCSCAVAWFGYFVAVFHIVKFSENRFPESNSNLLPLANSVTTVVTRLLFGIVADVTFVKKYYVIIHQAVFVINGVTTMCIPLSNTYAGFVVASCVLGVCDGLFFLLVGPIALSLVGLQGSSQAVGFFNAAIGLTFLTGPTLAGLMYDHYGSYDIAYHVFGIPQVTGALLMVFMRCVSRARP